MKNTVQRYGYFGNVQAKRKKKYVFRHNFNIC